MKIALQILQMASSGLLILTIMSQSRGAGLSETFGGGGGFYASKRGVEKILAIGTVIIATLFLVSSFLITIVT